MVVAAVVAVDTHWRREYRLTPNSAADNLDLQGGDWLALPWSNGDPGAPSGGHEGTIRWNSSDDQTEIWYGSQLDRFWTTKVPSIAALIDN